MKLALKGYSTSPEFHRFRTNSADFLIFRRIYQ